MSEFGKQDLYEVFKKINDRLDILEAGELYPTTSRQAFMGACMKTGKDMKECSELWEKVSKKKAAKGEQAAYGKPTKPYGKSFIETILETLRKAGIKLSEEDEKKLKALGEGTEEIFEGERIIPVFGQHGELIALQTPYLGGESLGTQDMRTVPLQSVLPQEPISRNTQFERDLQETADLVMRRGKYSNIAHQK